MTKLHVSEVAKIPWGASGIPEIFVDEPQSGLRTPKPPRQERAAVRLRLAPDGAFGLLAADPLTGSGLPPQILRLTPEGSLSHRLALAPPADGLLQWQILDFALDRDAAVYLLEQATVHGGGATILRKIGADGAEAWRRAEPAWRVDPGLEIPAWSFTGLLTGGSGLYLSAARENGLIARIDPAHGSLARYADLSPWTGDALVGPDEQVYFVRFVPERNARAWVRLDPRTGGETQALGAPEAFDLLAYPFGVDAEGRAYGTAGIAVGCIGPQGALLWRETVDAGDKAIRKAAGGDRDLRSGPAAWQVGRDGTIYLPVVGAAGLHLLALTH